VSTEPTPGRPTYKKVAVYRSVSGNAGPPPAQPSDWSVHCDEGWRTSVVCTGMYEWAADWLVEQLQGKPFAPGTRP